MSDKADHVSFGFEIDPKRQVAGLQESQPFQQVWKGVVIV
jgi:hypothetical protein